MMLAMRSRSRHRQRAVRVRIGRSLAALGLALGGLALAAAFLGITVQANALAREKAALRGDIAAETARQAGLTQHIAQQKTPDYVTQMARSLGLIGPNESLFAVPRETQASETSTAAHPVTSRLSRWMAFFFSAR
jgi:cell division protein FtsB